MVTTFVRVTVIADDVQLDVSLPAHRPVIDFLPDVLELLELEVGDDPSGWALSSSATGELDPLDTLADRDFLDGSTVHLTRAEHAAATPFVDDVLAEMTRTVDAGFARWTGEDRTRWMSALSAGLISLSAVGVFQAIGGVLSGSALAGLVVVTLLLAALSPERIGRWTTVASGVASALSAWRFTEALGTDARLAIAGGAAALAVAAVGIASRRPFPTAPVGIALAVVLGACGLAFALGLSSVATAAWGSIVFLVGLILTPRWALVSSGLLAQLQRSEQLELSSRAEIDRSLTRGRRVVDTAVWSIAVLAAAAAATITLRGVWQQGLISALLGLLLIFRSRSFAHARHVGPLVAAGAFALLITAFRLPTWLGVPDWVAIVIWASAAAVLLVGFVLSGTVKLNEVNRAEMRGWLDAADLLLMLAYVPVLVFAQGIYPYFWP
ncbi:EsaB/YukD family protein [Dietzia cercidiphylli]|uniref:EsaB/YukD family protein n=1 Tax=Dietzia cercidiphylli TaxID=498199 RepID=UPI00223B731E|nr:EsaB/YukD family protein [Dietzia cercidiphylli]MCT1515380.1 EsaB/YukD family protein [Dietzia cercidiphylli]